MDNDTRPARERARDAALQRAPGSTAGTVAESIAEAASDQWEPGVLAARNALRDIDGTPHGGVAQALAHLTLLLGDR